LKKLFKKIAPVKIYGCAYIFKKKIKREDFYINNQLRVFTKNNKSGIKKIDAQLNSNNECYAVFDNDMVVHTSWLFKKKLLTTQLGFRDVYTIGNSYTVETYRGKGIYTGVLKMICSQKDKEILIFVSPYNLSSKRAIEKAGFEKLYEFQLFRFLGVKIRIRKSEDRN
jgi:hypothetical protein